MYFHLDESDKQTVVLGVHPYPSIPGKTFYKNIQRKLERQQHLKATDEICSTVKISKFIYVTWQMTTFVQY